MGEFIDVAGMEELADGEMRVVKAGGREVLLVRVGDAFYASGGRCPHQGAFLSDGRLDGTVVTCPMHGARFDLADGSVVHWAGADVAPPRKAKPFETFEVKVEGGRVFVLL
jgi:3-phenylpropionate/trans-cinnamate dioxygenase ferredoxin component